MSIIKSYAVGNGDMFYIEHGSDNFTVIDCCLSDDNKEIITDEISARKKKKGVTRFISTHPDEDHIHGLCYFDDALGITNFYCVKNTAKKKDETKDFKRYCQLRDSNKVFNLYEGCSRKWMNSGDEIRKSSGINILWPITDNEYFKSELDKVEQGESPNNISPIIKYSLQNGINVIWFGDLEKDFLEKVMEKINFSNVDIIFAPHHGRKSGKIPKEILDKLQPKIVIIGESASENLDYYSGYHIISQNSAGDIILECLTGKTHVMVSNENYKVDFLENQNIISDKNYIGTLILEEH